MTSMQWAFLGGDTSVNNVGSYGSIGVECSFCWPPSRRLFQSFYDPTERHYYIYGGINHSHRRFADLWRWSVLSGRWTWISGSSALNFEGNHHMRGWETSLNLPNCRSGSVFVFDQQNRLFYMNLGASRFRDLGKRGDR